MDAKRQSVAAAEDRAFAGDFAGAAARMRGACDDDPADPDLWFLLGYYLARGGDLDGAARALGEALSIAPDHGMAHHHMANCLRDMHRLDLAGSHYRRAVDALEDEPDAIADFGLCHLRSGDFDLASALFRRALSLEPGCELAIRGLEAMSGMEITEAAGNPIEPEPTPMTLQATWGPEAATAVETAVFGAVETRLEASRPEDTRPEDTRPQDTRPQDTKPEAAPGPEGDPAPEPPPQVPAPRQLPRLDRRLRGPAARMAGATREPGPPPRLFEPAASAAQAGNPGFDLVDQVDRVEEPQLAELKPTSISDLILAPDVDWQTVAAEAETSAAANPEDFEAWLRLGGALVRLRTFEQAVPVLERVMARTEGRGAWSGVHAEALALLAEVLLEKKDGLAAYRVGQTLQRLYPNRPRTLYLTGRISHLCGDPRQALRSLKEAARLDPEGPVGRVALEAIAEMGG